MYNDWFSIGPLTVHGYGVCIAAGLLSALFMSTKRAKKKGLSDDICYGIVLCCAFFGFMGSKILYCIVEWDSFIKDPISFISSSGFVVYGGLTTAIISIIIYTKIKKANPLDYLELIAPSVPLAQALGRLGCFFAGCCYGRKTDSWIGITFHNSDFAPNGVSLMPTQLISVGANLLHMVALLIIEKHTKKKGIVTGCYIMFYSIGRFFIEMLRDDNRGAIGNLSTSQFYGMFTLLIGIAVFVWGLVHKEKEVVISEEEKVINEEV